MSHNDFDDLIEVRNVDIQGETNWYWIKQDQGAWTGPRENWESSHSTKYFRYLKKHDLVITAGANQGMHVRFFAKKFKRVYAFEPDYLNFHCMVLNNQYPNVVRLQAALGSENKLIDVNRAHMDNTGMHKVKDGNMIPMFTIDTFNFDACDFIQLDVEDYEPEVLKGAVETIKKFHPVISAENGHHVAEFLTALDYRKIDQSSSDSIFVHNSDWEWSSKQ